MVLMTVERFCPMSTIYAIDVLAALVDDGVKGERTASKALITNEQLTLPLADGDECVDHFDAGIQGVMDKGRGPRLPANGFPVCARHQVLAPVHVVQWPAQVDR